MNNSPEFLFQTIFNHLAEPRIVVRADAPYFTIVVCNEKYKTVSHTTGRSIIGKGIQEVHNLDGINAEGDSMVQKALTETIATRQAVKLSAVRFDIPNADTGEPEERWWQAEYIPIPGANGETAYVMCTTHNITEQIIDGKALQTAKEQDDALQREKALTEKLMVVNRELQLSEHKLAKLNNELEVRVESRTRALALSEENFRSVILQAPVAMGFFSGEEMVLELINDTFLDLWDKPASVIGKPLLEALPELRGQPYLQIMQDVMTTGKTYYGNKSKVMLRRNGVLEEGYYNFINHAFKDAKGNNTGIIVVAMEVTEQVLSHQQTASAIRRTGICQ